MYSNSNPTSIIPASVLILFDVHKFLCLVLSLGVRRQGREAHHSPPSSAGVKEWVELYLHSPKTPPWRGA